MKSWQLPHGLGMSLALGAVFFVALSARAVTEPTIDPTTYAVDATPKSVLVTFADGPDTRGFAWMTDTTVDESKLWVIEGSHTSSEAALFDAATPVEGSYTNRTQGSSTTKTVRCHKARKSGLASGTTYSYRVGGAGNYAYGTFVVGVTNRSVTALYVGDQQVKYTPSFFVWENSVQRAAAVLPPAKTDLILSGGDVFDLYAASISEYQYLKWGATIDSATPYYPGVPWALSSGNHDLDRNGFTYYADLTAVNYQTPSCHSFNLGAAHFVILPLLNDNGGQSVTNYYAPVAKWAEADLKKANTAGKTRWNIVMIHWGPYTTGDHGLLEETSNLVKLVCPIFSSNRVDLVLQAHDHTYSKTLPYRWNTVGYTTDRTDATIVNTTPATTTIGGVAYDLDPRGTYYVCTGCSGPRVYEGNGEYATAGSGSKSYDTRQYKIATGKISVTSTYGTAGADGSSELRASMFGVLKVDDSTLSYDWYAVNTNGQEEAVLYDTLRIAKSSPISEYVQKGLVACWDAKCNQGMDADYDPTATTWVDVSGQGQTATMPSDANYKPLWGQDRAFLNPSNGLTRSGYMTFTPSAAMLAAVNSTNWTQQICQKTLQYFYSDMAFFGLVTGQSSQTFYLRSDYAWNNMMHSCGGYNTFIGQFNDWFRGCCDTVVRDGKSLLRDIDAKLTVTVTAPSAASTITGGGRIGSVMGSGNLCDYELYAVRFYDRSLSQVEVAHNANVDARRHLGGTVETNYVHSLSSGGSYGSPSPAYGSPTRAETGAVRTFSVASSVKTYEADGVLAAAVSANSRAAYLGASVRKLSLDSGMVAVTTLDAATTSYDATVDTDYDITWKWKLQYALQASSADASLGSVQINSRTAAASDEVWYDAADKASVTVTAVPGEGMKFDAWSGDVPAEDLTNATVTLTLNQGRTVKASFVEAHHEPVTLTWKNTSGAAWNDAASWAEGAVPQDGDTVIITPNGANVIELDVSMPHLEKLVISNRSASATVTVRPATWFCKIWADEMVFGRNVALTTAKAFSTSEMSNRVWIVASNLTMHSTTQINLDNRGWVDKASPWYGRDDRAGGGHGGRGGPGYTQGCNLPYFGNSNPKTSALRYTCQLKGYEKYGCAYDSLEAPELPGASSDKSVDYTGRAGGGAVRIDVQNHAQVEGKIYVRGYGIGNGSTGAAAGGSVWVSAKTVDGAAYFYAGQTVQTQTTGGGGGGGRIAVTYDAAAQKQAGYKPTFEFRLGGEVGRPIAFARDTNSNPYYPGEEGTLFLTDTNFFPRARLYGGGRVYFGTVPGDTLAFPEGLTISGSSVGFPQFRKVRVDGDLVIGGCAALICSNVALTVTGDVTVDSAVGYSSAGAYNSQCCGLELLHGSTIDVGGDFSIKNYGMLWALSGPTNATSGPFTADIAVKGDFTMSEKAWFIPETQPMNENCGAVRLTAENVSVGASAMIDGRGRGFQTFVGFNKTYGPGKAPANGRGASHAGWGGVGYGGSCDNNKPWLGEAAGKPYGDWRFPITPGSAGGYANTTHFGSFGGGQIYIEARRVVTVDGTISVAGQTKGGNTNERGAGSGGSICIKARRLAGSGKLIADGGKNGTTPYSHGWSGGGGGGGGGGYIRVMTENLVSRHFTGTMSAIGGNAYTSGEYLTPTNRYATWDHRGYPGTITTHARQGMVLMVR